MAEEIKVEERENEKESVDRKIKRETEEEE